MAVPGIRRVRSRTFRGATEMWTRSSSRPPTWSSRSSSSRTGSTRSGRTCRRTRSSTVERLTPATFPVLSLNVTGALPVPDLYDYAFYVMRPALARAPGAGRIEVSASDTREVRGHRRSDAARGRRPRDERRHRRPSSATNVLAPVGRFAQGGRQYLALATGQWRSLADIAATPILSKSGSIVRVSDVGDVVMGSPDRTLARHGQRTRRRGDQPVAAGRLRRARREVRCRAGARRSLAHAALRAPRDEGVRPRGVRRRGDFQRARRDRHRRPARRRRPVPLPARLACHRRGRDDVADHGRSRRSSSCGSGASRST